MPYYRWKDIPKDVEPGETLPAGMSRRGIMLGDLMLCMHEAFPNLSPNPHTHESGQTVIMVKGQMKLMIGNEERIISPGDFAYVPPGIEHKIESLDEYVLELDIFHPHRPDILRRLKELEGDRR
jgi:mannose-6-phosphate isomerase-like protein (cupin superfamily)